MSDDSASSRPPPPTPHPLVADFPILLDIPVQWGEMDAYGHVNNTVLFRYFESARIAYLERCGLIESYERNRIGAILQSTECRFRMPLHYPDTVVVGARGDDVKHDRFTMYYRVVSRSHDTIAAEGRGVIVSFDYVSRTKAPLPTNVRARIKQLEGETAVR